MSKADVVRCEALYIPTQEMPDILPEDETAISTLAEKHNWKRIQYPNKIIDNKDFITDIIINGRDIPVWNA